MSFIKIYLQLYLTERIELYILRLSFVANNTMHVSPHGPPQQVVLFLNPPLGIFPELARVGQAGQPTYPYGCYH